jgi:hypothetical protein
MAHLYTTVTTAIIISLLVCAAVGRRTGDLTPRTACGLEVLAAITAAVYAYLHEDWPWDAINVLIALALAARWAMYPTKREREAKQP